MKGNTFPSGYLKDSDGTKELPSVGPTSLLDKLRVPAMSVYGVVQAESVPILRYFRVA